jgi:hypothetical protein
MRTLQRGHCCNLIGLFNAPLGFPCKISSAAWAEPIHTLVREVKRMKAYMGVRDSGCFQALDGQVISSIASSIQPSKCWEARRH